jgi:GDP-mannose transporter
MVGSLNKLPIAISGMVFFNDPITFGGVTGVLMAFSAGLLYTAGKNQQAKEASAKAPLLPISTSATNESSKPLLKEESLIFDASLAGKGGASGEKESQD